MGYSFTHLRTHSVVVMRMSATGAGNDKIAEFTITGTLPVHIQPTSDAKSGEGGGKFGRRLNLYADGGADLHEGDKLRNKTTNELYEIVSGGVKRRTFSCFDFLEVSMDLTEKQL
jgi:hypothetical protein